MVEGPVAKRRVKRRTLRNAVLGGVAFIIVAIAAGTGWKLFTTVSASNEQAQAEEREQRTRQLAKSVQANFSEIAKPVSELAKSKQTIQLFEQADKAALEQAADEDASGLPFLMKLRYLLPGDYQLDTQSKPPFSYASLDLLRQAEKTSQVNAEVLMLDSPQEHIVLIERVVNKSLELVGLIHASLSVDFFEQLMESINMQQGYVELTQRAGGRTLTLASLGNQGFKEGEPTTVSVNDTNWVINYWSETSPPVASEDHGQGLPLIPIAAVLVFLMLAAIFFLKKKERKPAASDDDEKSSVTYEGAHEGVSKVIPHLPKGKKKAKETKPISQGLTGEDITTMPKRDNHKQTAPTKAKAEPAAKAQAETKPEPTAKQTAAPAPAAPAKKPSGPVKLDPVIFRTYDIRGVVDETLTVDGVREIAKALGTMAIERDQKTFTVGRDGRLSGPKFVEALIEGLRSTGIDVIDVGMVPTPVLYFSTYQLETQCGVMVTGSHNPPEYNGLKMMLGGNTLSGDDIQEIRERTEKGEYATGKGQLTNQEVNADYIARITNDIPVSLGNSLKIVVDCGNGVAGVLAPQLLKALNHDVIEMYCDIDGNFPNHHPDPSQPENLQEIIEKVKTEGADVGFAFDGDGDRLGIVDAEGNIIWPDRQMMLLAKDVLSRNAGASIIYDVKCSRYLKTTIEENGGQPMMWKTGHSLIKGKMREVEAPLAGEMSGHIFFKERWYGFDDALYTAARFIEIFVNSGKKPTELFNELPDGVSTPELRMAMPESEHGAFMTALIQTMQDSAGGEVSDIDGVRIEYEDGWGLARPSNTSPNIILRFEGEDEAALERIKTVFKEAVLSVKADAKLPF